MDVEVGRQSIFILFWKYEGTAVSFLGIHQSEPDTYIELRSFEGFDQMSAFWSMFWFKPFWNFLRKIAIFRNFDHWSELLSMLAGRPLSQGVCPPLSPALHLQCGVMQGLLDRDYRTIIPRRAADSSLCWQPLTYAWAGWGTYTGS